MSALREETWAFPMSGEVFEFLADGVGFTPTTATRDLLYSGFMDPLHNTAWVRFDGDKVEVRAFAQNDISHLVAVLQGERVAA